jgi:hypothetical protein
VRRQLSASIVAATFAGCLGTSGLTGGSEPIRADADASASDASEASAEDTAMNEEVLPSPPCPIPSLFCDDFESGTLEKWQRSDVSASGSEIVAVDTRTGGESAHGRHALSAYAAVSPDPATVDNHAVVEVSVPPTTSGVLAFRAYVKFPEGATPTGQFFWLHGATQSVEIQAYGPDGVFRLEGQPLSTAKVPVGRWFCFEVVVKVATQGRILIFSDGSVDPVLSADLDTLGDAGDGYSSLNLGIIDIDRTLSERIGFDDVFDDVALVGYLPKEISATTRIGCP